ncbi:glutathione hydrolase 1 proenzyme-like [Amphiura filiformis]|uniref:glutathione hydrolase 1 proenzyme-like n=1 Tax=Amphiura filiformis TaxID=82378 RepID=UPI003B21BAE1
MAMDRLTAVYFSMICFILAGHVPLRLCCWGGSDLDKYTFEEAAIAADHETCSKIGRDIMRNLGGNAADAAIAAMLCVGVLNAHSAGLGGGHISVFYDRETGNAYEINARERAPMKPSQDLINNPWKTDNDLEPFTDLYVGYLGCFIDSSTSRALPHNRLLNDNAMTIELCLDHCGSLGHAYAGLQYGKECWCGKATDDYALHGATSEYECCHFCSGNNLQKCGGSLRNTVYDLRQRATITPSDLSQYETRRRPPLSAVIGDSTFYTAYPPGRGVVAAFVLNILEGFGFDATSVPDGNHKVLGLTYHRIVEAFKFGCAKSAGLGDIEFDNGNVQNIVNTLLAKSTADQSRAKIRNESTLPVTEYGNHKGCQVQTKGGTTHVSVLDQYGNAVAMTSSINQYFGARVRGNKTGIIYNDHMADFSHKKDANYVTNSGNEIVPGQKKHPMSAMSPSIMVSKDGDVRLVTGGAGSDSITTSTTLVITNSLRFGDNVKKSVKRPRIYYKGLTKKVQIERELYKKVSICFKGF